MPSHAHTHTHTQVSGIEGNFRSTCEAVMRVLRTHKESVMAVLEAFVYDPLLSWRLDANNTSLHDAPDEMIQPV
jgi:phosphatidylinositol kinase/protein kinase (PI-3  family)